MVEFADSGKLDTAALNLNPSVECPVAFWQQRHPARLQQEDSPCLVQRFTAISCLPCSLWPS
jgi:hypothetical protein